jgi:hypothetical protein
MTAYLAEAVGRIGSLTVSAGTIMRSPLFIQEKLK